MNFARSLIAHEFAHCVASMLTSTCPKAAVSMNDSHLVSHFDSSAIIPEALYATLLAGPVASAMIDGSMELAASIPEASRWLVYQAGRRANYFPGSDFERMRELQPGLSPFQLGWALEKALIAGRVGHDLYHRAPVALDAFGRALEQIAEEQAIQIHVPDLLLLRRNPDRALTGSAVKIAEFQAA